MDRKLFGIFSGWQITFMFGIAVSAPTALFGAVATQAVSITNPNTGVKAAVDRSGRLFVLDTIGSYRNNPANLVEIPISNTSLSSCEGRQYPIPKGKILVITGINGFVAQTDNNTSAGLNIFDGKSCSGNLVISQTLTVGSASRQAPLEFNLGSGIVVAGGSTLSVQSLQNAGMTFIQGYLVPASAIPAEEMADAAPQGRPIAAEEAVAKTARLRR